MARGVCDGWTSILEYVRVLGAERRTWMEVMGTLHTLLDEGEG